MITNPLQFLTGWQGYAAAVLVSAAVAAVGAWTVQGWRYGEQIAGMERDQAQATAERNQKAADAQALARAVENARQNKIEGIVNEANQKAAQAAADATAR
jgi:prophage endopeptidase